MEFTAQGVSSPVHYDFTTPEYQVLDSIAEQKWETCRGIGLSFGYNRTEDVDEFLSVDKLVDSFVDIVSKNGNLLLNVGPKADGTIPDGQQERLLGLGRWLETNGEAIFATHPWIQAAATTQEGGRVRFTQQRDTVYAILLDSPKKNRISLPLPTTEKVTRVVALRGKKTLAYEQEENVLLIDFSSDKEFPAYAFGIRF